MNPEEPKPKAPAPTCNPGASGTPAASSPPAHPVSTRSGYILDGMGKDVLDSVDPVTRIQALLAQWLRMENVVVLMGAGASVACGGPVIRKLEDYSLSALKGFCTEDGLRSCAPIVDRRLATISEGKATINFEQWLSHIASAHHVLSSQDTPIEAISLAGAANVTAEELETFLRVTSQVIFVRCSLRLPKVTDRATGYHSLLAKLVARDSSLGRTNVFTTNYDTLIEQALDDLAIHYSDGFVGTVERRFDPSCYGLDMYYPGEVSEGRVRRFDKFLHLHKLHGSVHWRRRKDGKVIQSCDLRLGAWKEWATWPLAKKKEAMGKWFGQDEDALGIIPTEDKFVQTLGMPYAHLFRAFHQRLQVPQTFFLVIGYGFGDDHINAIIDDAITNPSLVMLVVDPAPSNATREHIQRFQQSGERAFLLRAEQPVANQPSLATFDDFARNLMPNIQWLDDFTRLRKAEQALQKAQGDGSTKEEKDHAAE